ncbi:hypothetical protein D0N36_01830 [Hymenobacter lapidiphilus]|uniref:hypothetical protein n=1 Tax=Hymenobacter sp. CCM 8763 TaxID=2303334 RepID=UPI000E34375D|nr:hypothetical protein [Hymenobacter sp. CCM 8763]RFP66850.1 hypothetical protein D0N36_01830 [Hymenobacter sp. CCM 8763]
MKNAIRRVIVLFIFAAAPLFGRAQTTPPAAADSVTQQRLVQQVSADMCRRLELENQKSALTNLSKAEAEQLFSRLFLQAAASNDELATFLTKIGEQGAREQGEQLGRRVGLVMMRECPVGQQLFMRLGGEQVSQQQGMRPEETTLLQPIATAMCRDLTPRVAELRKLPLPKRMSILTEVLSKNLKPYAKQLGQLYGADIFLNKEGMEKLGAKIAALMAPKCPEVLVLFTDFDKIDR